MKTALLNAWRQQNFCRLCHHLQLRQHRSEHGHHGKRFEHAVWSFKDAVEVTPQSSEVRGRKRVNVWPHVVAVLGEVLGLIRFRGQVGQQLRLRRSVSQFSGSPG
jgi:hypothetical protein